MGYYGFFGFFGFFGFARAVYDERLDLNVNRAARNAFVSSLLVFALTTAYQVVGGAGDLRVYAYAFAGGFALQMLAFSLSLVYYERRGI